MTSLEKADLGLTSSIVASTIGFLGVTADVYTRIADTHQLISPNGIHAQEVLFGQQLSEIPFS